MHTHAFIAKETDFEFEKHIYIERTHSFDAWDECWMRRCKRRKVGNYNGEFTAKSTVYWTQKNTLMSITPADPKLLASKIDLDYWSYASGIDNDHFLRYNKAPVQTNNCCWLFICLLVSCGKYEYVRWMYNICKNDENSIQKAAKIDEFHL